jgi:hypothetical protein
LWIFKNQVTLVYFTFIVQNMQSMYRLLYNNTISTNPQIHKYIDTILLYYYVELRPSERSPVSKNQKIHKKHSQSQKNETIELKPIEPTKWGKKSVDFWKKSTNKPRQTHLHKKITVDIDNLTYYI